MESLGQAAKSIGFAVPGALGVQEGGYLVIGGLLGVPPEIALALSVVKRLREVLLGLPGLALWQRVSTRAAVGAAGGTTVMMVITGVRLLMLRIRQAEARMA